MHLSKINRVLGVILSFLCLIIVSGCKKEGTVTVSCSQVDKYQSPAGVLNVPHFIIGDVIVLNTKTKKAFFKGHLDVSGSELSESEPIDTFVVLTETSFDVDFQGELNEPKYAKVQTDVKSMIEKNTLFYLVNNIRKNTKDPDLIMNRDSLLAKRWQEGISDDVIFMFVSGIVFADDFQFKLRNATTTSTDTQVLTYGTIKLIVSYKCKGSVKVDAKRGGIFFKGSFYKPNKDKNGFVMLTDAIVNLADYELYQTLR